MKTQNSKLIGSVISLVLVLGGVFLAQKAMQEPQDIRRKAAVPNGPATINLTAPTAIQIGSAATLGLNISTPVTPNNKGVTVVRAVVNYTYEGASDPLSFDSNDIQTSLPSPWSYLRKEVTGTGNAKTITIEAAYLAAGENGYVNTTSSQAFAALTVQANAPGNVHFSLNTESSKILAKEGAADILNNVAVSETISVGTNTTSPTATLTFETPDRIPTNTPSTARIYANVAGTPNNLGLTVIQTRFVIEPMGIVTIAPDSIRGLLPSPWSYLKQEVVNQDNKTLLTISAAYMSPGINGYIPTQTTFPFAELTMTGSRAGSMTVSLDKSVSYIRAKDNNIDILADTFPTVTVPVGSIDITPSPSPRPTATPRPTTSPSPRPTTSPSPTPRATTVPIITPRPTSTPIATVRPTKKPRATKKPRPTFNPKRPTTQCENRLPGDINCDGTVNILDYTILFENIRKRILSDTKADLNKDGKVNILDYTILFESFGNNLETPEE